MILCKSEKDISILATGKGVVGGGGGDCLKESNDRPKLVTGKGRCDFMQE